MEKWVNEGPAPDGACPSCPDMGYPAAGTWDGVTARCQNGDIVKVRADGMGGWLPSTEVSDIIHAKGTPQATQACNENLYIGTGPITNYFA